MALAGVRVHFAVFRNVTPIYGMLENTILSGTAIKMIRSLAGRNWQYFVPIRKRNGKMVCKEADI